LNAVLSSPDAVRELGPGLYTAFPQDAGAAPYDRRAIVYDAVVRWSIYHRIFWGTSTLAYRRFSRAAAAVPVHAGIFSSILSLNLLHVECDRTAIVTEFSRLLIPGRGRLFVSSLIRSGRWSDAYLTMLHRAGEFGPPQTLDELCETVAGRWGVVESTRVQGNMSFLVVRHAGSHRSPDDCAH